MWSIENMRESDLFVEQTTRRSTQGLLLSRRRVFINLIDRLNKLVALLGK